MNTAVYMLRCFQLGMHVADLDNMTVGLVTDILTEAGNDNYEYRPVASQEDFNAFNLI